MVKDSSDNEGGNLLASFHEPLLSTGSKGSVIYTIPKIEEYIPWPLLHQLWRTGWNKKKINGSIKIDLSENPVHHEKMLYH